MAHERIFDADGTYELATFGVSDQLPSTIAVSVLQSWMRHEPERSRLRLAAYRLLGRPSTSDEELLVQLTALVRAGRLQVGRTLRPLVGGSIGGAGDGAVDSDAADPQASTTTEPQIHPCDFETLVLKCSHMGTDDRSMADARFWKEGTDIVNNLPQPSGGRAFVRMIEVVAGHDDKGADTIDIGLEGGPGYTCSRTHPKITISSNTGDRAVYEGETNVTLKAKCRELPTPRSALTNPLEIIRYHFFPTQAMNVYTIDVESCGKLDTGAYGFGRTKQKVRVYPKDTYKLSLSIPAFKKKTYEKSRVTHPDGTVVSKQEYTKELLLKGEKEAGSRTESIKESGYESEDAYSYQTRQGGLEEKTKTVTGQGQSTSLDDKPPIDGPLSQLAPGFALTRNGTDIKGTESLGAFVDGLIKLERNIQEIMNFVRDFQPQVGWKFVFELELFKGDLAYEWGFKEWNDQTVYEWWKFDIGMTLFALKLEVSFGAEFKVCGFGITAAVFGNISVEAKASASKEATPDDSKPWELAVAGGPKGELGIRSALGADWVKAEGKLTVGLDFEAKCVCSTKDPFHIDWKLDFAGVKAVVTGSVKWVGSIEREWTLVDPKKNWRTGRFPSAR